jgi:hypothetical protein
MHDLDDRGEVCASCNRWWDAPDFNDPCPGYGGDDPSVSPDAWAGGFAALMTYRDIGNDDRRLERAAPDPGECDHDNVTVEYEGFAWCRDCGGSVMPGEREEDGWVLV